MGCHVLQGFLTRQILCTVKLCSLLWCPLAKTMSILLILTGNSNLFSVRQIKNLIFYWYTSHIYGARSFSLQKRYLQNFFLQNISLQRLFLQEFFSTEVIPTQRLNLQHNIPTEFLSTLPSSYIPFFIQRLYLQENFSEKIYHKFLFQRTE